MAQQNPVHIKLQPNLQLQSRQNVVEVPNSQPRISSAGSVALRTSGAAGEHYILNEDMNQFSGQSVHPQSIQLQYNYPAAGAVAHPLSQSFMGPPGFGAPNTGRKQCNCTKSNCLKLYCECFAQGQLCQNCNCTNCMNNLAHEEERRRAVKMTLERNPTAFNPKIGRGEGERKHTKGCNCKRSSCLKNYCECYEAKISCSKLCRCQGCQNTEDSVERRSLLRLSVLGSLKSKQNTSYKRSLTAPPLETLPHSFFTWETIEAMVGCMLAQAEDAEQKDASLVDQEKMILEEFGRSIEHVIKASSKAQVRPICSSIMHGDQSNMPLEDDMGDERGNHKHLRVDHDEHMVRQASDDEYIEEVDQLEMEAHQDSGDADFIQQDLASKAHLSRPPLRSKMGQESYSEDSRRRSGSRGLTSLMDNLNMMSSSGGSTRSGRKLVPSRRFKEDDSY